jgi:hypothetical protein
MASRQSHLPRLGTVTHSSWESPISLPTHKYRPRNYCCLFLGIIVLALLFAAYESQPSRAKGIRPGYFTVKPHESMPLREIDEPPAEYERVIDAKQYLEAPAVSQAGAHPDLTVSFVLVVESRETALNGEDVPSQYVVQLPPGLVANFGSIPACKLTAFESTVYDNETSHCSAASQLGVVSVLYGGELTDRSYPLYKIDIQNLYGTHGEHLAAIGFPYELITERVPIILRADLRTDSDYGLTLTGRGRFPEFTPAPFFTFWGDPWSPTHDRERWNPETQQWGASVDGLLVPFITTSSDCNSGVLESKIQVQYWWEPERWFPDNPEDFAYRSFLPQATGCKTEEFDPRGAISPTSNELDSSTGLNVNLEAPSHGTNSQESPPLKNLSITLPAGMSVNPATLNGMDGCTPSQIGLMDSGAPGSTSIHFARGEAHCPDASKIGTGIADTPLADGPVKVGLYFATPYENPFHSLMVLYAVFESLGFTIKLAAKVEANPITGQLTTKMEGLPQLPLERLSLKVFDGPRAPLSAPETCDVGSGSATLDPWSAPESGPPRSIQTRTTFNVADGQGPCSASGVSPAPVLTAGLRDVAAGGASPFIFRMERPQGSPSLKAITLKLPPGVAANLQGVSFCGNASIELAEGRNDRGGGVLEQQDPSCPMGSKVGSVLVGAGTGSSPVFSKGAVYLAGPYKGAPLSLAVITPALAGESRGEPLVDLGAVVVRVALQVDPRTGQITAITDPLPQIVDGIPLRIHDIRLLFDRANFVQSPTSCAGMKVEAEIDGPEGSKASSVNRFQLGGCRRLRFHPKLKVAIDGKDDRHRAPSLQAVVTSRPGDANISGVRITFPASVAEDRIQVRDACPWNALLEGNCSRRSIYGHVVAWSPLLPEPLSGQIYATAKNGQLDLALGLNGQVSIIALGKVSSRGGRFRVAFSGLPDLPLSRIRLSLRGGSRGVSIDKSQLCGRSRTVVGRFSAHSGSVSAKRPILGTGKLCAGRIHVNHPKRKQAR